MTIPNIPTDNLYKFIALVSAIFLLMIMFIMANEIINLRIEVIKLNGDIYQINNKIKYSEMKYNDIGKLIELFNNTTKISSGKVTDSMLIWDRLIIGDSKYAKLSNYIDSLINNYKEIKNQIEIYNIDIKTKREIINDKDLCLNIILFVGGILIPILIFVMVYGFKKWYNKTQIYQDIILKYQADKIKEEISSIIKE